MENERESQAMSQQNETKGTLIPAISHSTHLVTSTIWKFTSGHLEGEGLEICWIQILALRLAVWIW